MKTKDMKDLHTKTKEELLQMAKDMKADIYKMLLDHTTRKLKGTQSIFNKKKRCSKSFDSSENEGVDTCRQLMALWWVFPQPKTVIVEVIRRTPHKLYKKLLKRSKKYKVDSGVHDVAIGGQVRIAKMKPMSREKHFTIVEVIT